MAAYYILPWSDYPFQQLADQNGKIVSDVLVLTAPIYAHESAVQEKFWSAKREGKICLGIMSCGHWPHYNKEDSHMNSRLVQITTSECQKIIHAMDGWLYCSRVPPFPNVPNLLLSESDMVSPVPEITTPWAERPIDIVFYAGLTDTPYYHYHKQVPEAIRILKYIKEKTGCRAIVVGLTAVEGLDSRPKLLWHEWAKYLETCKIILTTAVSDASPRTITDALNRGCAILVNDAIVGGWKYVSPESGAFYTPSTNPTEECESALRAYYQILEANKRDVLHPQKHFYEHFGRKKMGEQLHNFVEDLRIRRQE
jgi:hypothetical protein